MAAAPVPMVIEQGEDWTAEIVWTDEYNEPVEVIHPCRMDIRSRSGQTYVSLSTQPDIPDGEVPGINISSEMGLIQLHIPRNQTSALLPGEYLYDLFVSVGSADAYGGIQQLPLVRGKVTVNKRVTKL